MEVILLGFHSENWEKFEGEGTIVGDVTLLRQLLTVDNVVSVDANNTTDYEENCSGEFVFHLKNGDTVRMIGYHGMWEIEWYAKFKEEFQQELLSDMIEWAEDKLKWDYDDMEWADEAMKTKYIDSKK